MRYDWLILCVAFPLIIWIGFLFGCWLGRKR